MTRNMMLAPAVILWSLAAGACGEGRDVDREGETANAGVDTTGAINANPAEARVTNQATAFMRDAAGHELGTLTLTGAAEEAIIVTGWLTDVPPGKHAMHLHAVGSCEPPTFKSAGDHWNPTNRQHGTENSQGPHLGDLPNITVGEDSAVTVQGTTPGGALQGENALLDGDGAAVIIHAHVDDYRTDPSGNSGDPVACGVVRVDRM